MITEKQYTKVCGYFERAHESGTNIVSGGSRLDMPKPLANGWWLEPTLVTGVGPGTPLHDEEVFGPLLSVIPFENEAEALQLSNAVEYGLSGSVWTNDAERAIRVARSLDTGIIWVNNMLNGYPQISVPPHKMSGTGIELGMEGLLAYCKPKSLVMSYDPKAPVGWGL